MVTCPQGHGQGRGLGEDWGWGAAGGEWGKQLQGPTQGLTLPACSPSGPNRKQEQPLPSGWGEPELGYPGVSVLARRSVSVSRGVLIGLTSCAGEGGESREQGRGWENSREEPHPSVELSWGSPDWIPVGHPASQQSQGKALGCLEAVGPRWMRGTGGPGHVGSSGG